VPSGVSLIGSGQPSVLRIRANSGPFDTLFANADASAADIVLSSFTIDQNIAQNPGTISSEAGRHGYLIRFYAGRRVRIEGLRLLYAGINAVTMNGPDVADIELTGNYAEYHADLQSPPYDNTALYADGYRITAVNNTIIGKIVPGMPVINGGAIGAIELHGGPGLAAGNLIRDVRVCMSLVSAWNGAPDPRAANRIAAAGNRCEGVNEGIRLAAMSGRSLREVVVSGNEINVAQTRWNQHLSMGVELEWATDLAGDFDDIVIEGNVIRFEQEGAGSQRATALLSNVGIGLAPAGSVKRAAVTGNGVFGAPLMAMRIGNLLHTASSYRQIRVADNVFAGYGQNRLANSYFRLGIRTEGRLSDLTIEHNQFTIAEPGDARPALVMVPPGAATATSYEGCVIRENEGAEFSVIDSSCSVASNHARRGRVFRSR
jgi:hypothetical protein